METKQKLWHASKAGNDHQGLVIEEGGRTVAVSYQLADAALLAAAPDLLEACKFALEATDDDELVVRTIEAAIRKAECEAVNQ